MATVLVFKHPQSRADTNSKVIILSIIFPHSKHSTQHTQYAQMHTVTNPEPSNWPPLRFIWSGAVSSGSSWHNNPVSRLAAIASLALHSKQWPLSPSPALTQGPFRMTLACVKWANTCLFTRKHTPAHSGESNPVLKAHKWLLVEGRKQLFTRNYLTPLSPSAVMYCTN